MIGILLQNQEKHIVHRLIEELHNEMPHTNKILKTTSTWYEEIADDVLNLKYGSSIRDAFKEYLKKHHPYIWEDKIKIHR
ncbi:MAG TPA: hypothetical protein VNK44_07660 [Candidatus Nitrosotenuis sp.]|nr:hypothetical protein [Candidatus Nitrosotenuis sp.]